MAQKSVLIEEFDDLGFELEDPKIIDGLLALCDIYGLSEERLSCLFLAFSTSTPKTEAVLKEFEQKLKLQIRTSDTKKQIYDINSIRSLVTEEDDNESLYSSYGGGSCNNTNKIKNNKSNNELNLNNSKRKSPEDEEQTLAEEDKSSVKKYSSRTNSGVVLVKHGDNLTNWKCDSSYSVSLKLLSPSSELASKGPYRFMFERLRDKAGVLDETICRITDVLSNKHGLLSKFENDDDISSARLEPFMAFGRVCCDSDGRLNTHSIVLQGSQDSSFGRVVPLDASKVATEYSLFPGQVIGAKVTNPNGSRLVATEIISDASPEFSNKSSGNRISIANNDGNSDVISVVIASGPFTTSDNLNYEPFRDLLRYIRDQRPHVVILIGPFVDAKHSMIESGIGIDSFDSIFANRIMNPLVETLTESQRAVIVPSGRDVHHHFIYPTPPFEASSNKNQKVIMVSDPCMFSIDGVNFGVTATDILFHLGKEEISYPPRSGDRLRRLARHLLQQRSFYPLYPPSIDVNIDFEKLEVYGQIDVKPDVMILPSDLLHFLKEVDGVFVMNPQRLARGEGGGVFARMMIRKTASNSANEKFQAEILRI